MVDILYYNYHKHDHKGNVRSLDCVVKLEDYCKRAIELGHNAIFTTNHGIQGDVFEAKTLSDKYGLKMIIGCECYYVEDRLDKDRTNNHIVIVALNDEGVMELNSIISESNSTGFYYKPRIDKELLMSLTPKNVVITTACVAGILNKESLIKELKDKFKDNFFIEVQNHNEEIQKIWNKKALALSKKYNIGLIHGNDSHYIKQSDSNYRTLFLNAKGIRYEEETNFILDYPSYDEIVDRYRIQGILSDIEIEESLKNTLVFDKVEEITIYNDDIKLPSISKNPNKELKQIVAKAWKKEKELLPKKDIKLYSDNIKYEMDIIEKTHMEDYFIIDHKVVERAENIYGGKLTNTGRGSAPSFYINKLLGLTDLDRIDSPTTLFPTRFMSVERILGARSLADVDLNTSDRQPFIQATEDLLGKENCAWMIAWKPLQESSGFRLYCKAKGYQISEYDDVAKNLDQYRDDDYWGEIIEESKPFIGVVESISESPCSMLLYDKDVSKHVGLIRIKDKMYCLLDGYNCDKYKYLKNDYLSVTVWKLIKEVCDMVGIPIPTIKELTNMLDDKTFEIYSEGLTCTINQADSDWATNLVKKYKPKSVSEMSQFVAMIRPGCASLLSDFLDRKPYTTGVEALDEILKDSEHRMIYQESIMKYLIWLGISEPNSYDILKKIAKKKFKEEELKELNERLINGWISRVGTEDGFKETWKVVEDASKYSFNASHSLSYAYDSLYGAYLKSHYPLEYYSIALNEYSGDIDRTNKLTRELDYFNISINPVKFGYSKGGYSPSKKDNSIYKGIGSIKGLGIKDGEELYNLSINNKFNNFLELYESIKVNTSVNDGKIKVLIELNFFRDFGNSKYLLEQLDIYNKFKAAKQIKKDKLYDLGISYDVIKKYSSKETEKQFSQIDNDGLINYLISKLDNKQTPLKSIIKAEADYLGYPSTIIDDLTDSVYYVLKIDEFKNKKSITYYPTLYNIQNGEETKYRITDSMIYAENPFKEGDVIVIEDEGKSPKKRLNKETNKWEIVPNEYNNMLNYWGVY